MRNVPSIVGLGTALPDARVAQDVAAETVVRWAGLEGAQAAWARRVFARAGVGERRTVLDGFADGRLPFGGALVPGTAARMAVYRAHAGALAAAAASRALDDADVAAADVTHVVVVSCTGFHAPGVDVELVGRLGLRPDVDRLLIGFMGCHGAFAGLRAGRRAVEADARAVVLVVCVELCSIHLRGDRAPASLVAHALFGDGAAAAVLAARPDDALLALGPAASHVEPGTAEMMAWAIGDDGFEMTLAAAVPERLAGSIAQFASGLLPRSATSAWCVHPGGPSILAAAERALGLAPDDLDDSRAVLREIGNVSSATILFVLARAAARLDPDERGVALGFGPGLTIEGFAFTRGARVVSRAGVAAVGVAAGAKAVAAVRPAESQV